MALPSTGTIADAPNAGYHGDLLGGTYDVRGGLVKTVAAEAGRLVLRDSVGPNGEQNVAGLANSDTVDASTVFGFVIRDEFKAVADYGIGKQVEVARQGRMRLTATTDVVAGLPLFIGNVTATLNNTTDGTTTNYVQVPGARWATSASAGEIGVVEFDFRP